MNDFGLMKEAQDLTRSPSIRRWSVSERLQAEKKTLEDRLAQVNKALEALAANPQFSELFDLISKTI